MPINKSCRTVPHLHKQPTVSTALFERSVFHMPQCLHSSLLQGILHLAFQLKFPWWLFLQTVLCPKIHGKLYMLAANTSCVTLTKPRWSWLLQLIIQKLCRSTINMWRMWSRHTDYTMQPKPHLRTKYHLRSFKGISLCNASYKEISTACICWNDKCVKRI